jgi:16S rRNA (uracil1498-N3)-methyltransferase
MKSPPRFLVSAPAKRGLVAITGPELHHLRDVMRLRAGANVSILDGDGEEHRGQIESVEEARATVRILDGVARRPAPIELVLAPAIIKAPRMDFLVEKAAELSAAEFWPLLCARNVAGRPSADRLARWRRIAAAAAKQSLAPRLMEVKPPSAFAEFVDAVPRSKAVLVCQPGGAPLAKLIRSLSETPAVVIICGPEGGLDENELKRAAEAGFLTAGLGPNRLRGETAAIVALSVAASTLFEMEEES